MPAVNSGRSVSESPPRSSNVYISFETTSVRLAERAREHRGRLEHRHLDPAEAVEPAQPIERGDDGLEALGRLAEHVLGAANGLRGGGLAHRGASRTGWRAQ